MQLTRKRPRRIGAALGLLTANLLAATTALAGDTPPDAGLLFVAMTLAFHFAFCSGVMVRLGLSGLPWSMSITSPIRRILAVNRRYHIMLKR